MCFTEGVSSLVRHRDQASISAPVFLMIALALTFGWGKLDMPGESEE